jgi:hypothetical protein
MSQLESFLENYGVAGKLCQQAGEMGKENTTELLRCVDAFGDAGDLAQVEALAAKLDRMAPEDTIQQKVHLPLIRSIIERERGNATKTAGLLADAEQYEQTMEVPYRRAQAYLAAGQHAQAAAKVEEVINHRGWSWWQVYCTSVATRPCEGLCRTGRTGEKPQAHDEFFTWKKRRPGNPGTPLSQSRVQEFPATTATAASASEGKQ